MADKKRLKEETNLARKIPALFADFFFAESTSRYVRISFGEARDEDVPETQYRMAVVLPMDDARELAKVLMDIVGSEEKPEAKK